MYFTFFDRVEFMNWYLDHVLAVIITNEIVIAFKYYVLLSLLDYSDIPPNSDDQYVGSSTGLDEVNYRLQAFMELWKGLAHDVDDLYDKVWRFCDNFFVSAR